VFLWRAPRRGGHWLLEFQLLLLAGVQLLLLLFPLCAPAPLLSPWGQNVAVLLVRPVLDLLPLLQLLLTLLL